MDSLDREQDSTDATAAVCKRFMFIARRVPHGTMYPQEALDLVLMGSAFDQQISIVFIDDGVFQLKQGQNPEQIGIKNFAATFRALPDFDVELIYVERESLAARELTESDLLMPINLIGRDQLVTLMDQQDVLFEC